jgi:hypothetical protein
MRYSALFTVFVTVFLGFLQLAFATEDPEVVYETVHSTSTKTAVVTSTGAAPLAKVSAVNPGRVIKVFTISPEGQVLAGLGPTSNVTSTEAPTSTGVPFGNSTTSTSSTPTSAPTQSDADDKDSAGVMQMASLPLLVSVVAVVFGVITL